MVARKRAERKVRVRKSKIENDVDTAVKGTENNGDEVTEKAENEFEKMEIEPEEKVEKVRVKKIETENDGDRAKKGTKNDGDKTTKGTENNGDEVTEKAENEFEKMEIEPVEKVEKVRVKKFKTENDGDRAKKGTKSDGDMATKGTENNGDKVTGKAENKKKKMKVDEPAEKKDKLRRVSKKKKMRIRRKVRKQGLKFKVLNMLTMNNADITKNKEEEEKKKIKKEEDSNDDIKSKKNKNADITKDKEGKEKKKKKKMKKEEDISDDIKSKKNKKNPASKLIATYQWGITLAGIPKTSTGNIEELTNHYKQFNMQACALTRQFTEGQISHVLHVYFSNEEDMKNAVLQGLREFEGKTLALRTSPLRMVYVSGVPVDVNEETACVDLKEALGSAVYDIYFPKSNKGKLLGYAVAYVLDEAAHKKLLDGYKLNVWDREQCCCSKDDFFNRFVLNVLSGWEGFQDVAKDLKSVFQTDVQVGIDDFHKKLFFLDASFAQKIQKKSSMVINNRKIIFSHSGRVRFVMTGITRHTPRSEILALLAEVNAFNVQYCEARCKATFDVAAAEVEKCNALHEREFAGRKLAVYQSGGEELKSAKEISRKNFQEYVVKNDIKFRKGHRLHVVAKMYRDMHKASKSRRKPKQKLKSKKSKATKLKIMKPNKKLSINK